MVFSVFWTAAATAAIVGTYDQMVGYERVLVWLLPAFGVLFTYLSWRYHKRYQSVRTEVVEGVSVYVWVEFDGTEHWSTEDPRDAWDEDGDGDGDGGD